MKKLKLYIGSVLLLTFGVAATFCCCINQLTFVAKNVPACHKHASKTSDKNSSDQQCCHKNINVMPESRMELSNVGSFLIGYLSPMVSLDKPALKLASLFSTHFDSGPPGSVFESPLYIRHHNFRI